MANPYAKFIVSVCQLHSLCILSKLQKVNTFGFAGSTRSNCLVMKIILRLEKIQTHPIVVLVL
jgi:hypothetical protein